MKDSVVAAVATAPNTEVKPFKSAHPFARVVVIFMIALIPIFGISAVTSMNEIRLLNALNDENLAFEITIEEIEFHDFWYATFGYLQFLWYPALALFLVWFYKVYRNLPSLGGEGLEFRARSVIAFFFIPILSLWKPYRATEEIWKVSDPTVMTSDRVSRREIDIPLIVLAWWIVWVISNIVGWYSLRQSFVSEESIESYLRMDSIYLVSEILAAISVGLTAPIVREISKRQEKKIEILNSLKNIQNDSSIGGTKLDEDSQDFQGLKP